MLTVLGGFCSCCMKVLESAYKHKKSVIKDNFTLDQYLEDRIIRIHVKTIALLEQNYCVDRMKIDDFRNNYMYIPNTIGDTVNKYLFQIGGESSNP